ncbi:MAG: polymerase subunit sigma-24 [Frankiales bacterium]|nr:polymerase subunit sigma-24 [Frankiales bacterium]
MTVPEGTPDVGEVAPFAALFQRHFADMVQLAYLLGADDPENIGQEAFVRLASKQRILRDPNAASAYVRTTVVNLSRSRFRHLLVSRRAAGHLVQPSVPSSEDSVVTREDHVRVRQALTGLPRRQREVLVLRYWLDMTHEQIADELQLSIGSVKAYASRGLTALEAAVGDRR